MKSECAGSADGVGVQQRVAALDTSLFDHVPNQLSGDDRPSLLATQNAVGTASPFTYLEIGSYLGGTLQAPLADPRCTLIVSIDPRTHTAPDGRLGHYAYEVNTTERMLELLGDVPQGDLSKLETIEACVDDLDPDTIPRPDLCLIDGARTLPAVLAAARFCAKVTGLEGIIAFRDPGVVEKAILRFVRETPGPHRGYWLQDEVFVVELGDRTVLNDPRVQDQLGGPLWMAANLVGLDMLVLAATVTLHQALEGTLRATTAAKQRWLSSTRL
jgi:hypothetical protein